MKRTRVWTWVRSRDKHAFGIHQHIGLRDSRHEYGSVLRSSNCHTLALVQPAAWILSSKVLGIFGRATANSKQNRRCKVNQTFISECCQGTNFSLYPINESYIIKMWQKLGFSKYNDKCESNFISIASVKLKSCLPHIILTQLIFCWFIYWFLLQKQKFFF